MQMRELLRQWLPSWLSALVQWARRLCFQQLPGSPSPFCAGLPSCPNVFPLSALSDDLLIYLLAIGRAEEIAALASVAKRYANVRERAGWACAARRFGRRTNAPFGGGMHWSALARQPRLIRRPFDEDAFDATGAPPPDDLADAFFWAEYFTESSELSSQIPDRNSRPTFCQELRAVPPEDRTVGPELVLTGSLKGQWRPPIALRIMGALRSHVVVLYAWDRPSATMRARPGYWEESWDAENWDETIASKRETLMYQGELGAKVSWHSDGPRRLIYLSALYGMEILLPHATNALFSIRGEYLVPVGVELPEELQGTSFDCWGPWVPEELRRADPSGGDLSIRLKVPMQVLGHVKAWRHSELAMVGRAGGPAFVVGTRTPPPPNVAAAVESYYWKRRESWTVL